jgi:uncharacterized DUF497 family protein
MLDLNLARITGFQWDSGNAEKNNKHGVDRFEAEQVFFNEPLLLLADIRHSQIEKRFHALGVTDSNRFLHLSFTLRDDGQLIRIISVRDMSAKERIVYEQTA